MTTFQFKDNSKLPDIVSAHQLIKGALTGLAIVKKGSEVTLNRFYLDNEFFMFNFSVKMKGVECKYLISCPANQYGNWTIRSNKWNGQREPIDTTGLSFGHFIRPTDHVKKKK